MKVEMEVKDQVLEFLRQQNAGAVVFKIRDHLMESSHKGKTDFDVTEELKDCLEELERREQVTIYRGSGPSNWVIFQRRPSRAPSW